MNDQLAQRIEALGICPHGSGPEQVEIPDDVLEAALNVIEALRVGREATEIDYGIVRRYRFPDYAAKVAFEGIMSMSTTDSDTPGGDDQ